MFWIDVVSRIVHIATAITLVGGSVFTLLVLMPSAKTLDESVHQSLLASITGRWKRFVHGGVALFLISGFYNYFRAMPNHKGDGLYHALVGTKMILAFAVFFLAAAMVGRSNKLAFIRNSRKFYLTVLVILATVIVTISGYVKVRPSSGPDTLSIEESSAVSPSVHRGTLVNFFDK
ncbi:hypothetical protein LF1_12990 [Rubripirellula obstinata]|uniref:Copper resistance protein D n=1 Tax=Rubripirellula obstinata TaxID=406547 RepID=A0A5B1CDW2_9BACT|nr:hypothetical protein [Rubripirellula obstinata]KAA1258776.1 hypothetical protein LF1_12990 [Rubripirellula obstinata]